MDKKQELINKWDAFLLKIENRFTDSLNHAKEASVAQLEESDYDFETTMRGWQGMKAQIRKLTDKIDEVWDEKVEPQMESVGDFASDEYTKGSNLNDKLEEDLQRFERQLEGELSQIFYDHAIKVADKKHNCTQCDAEIQIRNDLFRAQYITCSFCNTVNTIAPEAKFLKVGWGIVDNIAKVKTQTEFDAMEAAVEAIRLHRGQAPESYWETYKKAHSEYWDRFFKARITLNSELQNRYEDDIKRKQKEFDNYKKIQTT
ncbi:hypothetical protein HNV08_12420 [Winogradskyella eckloniae]|uniref:hypothetical protein n=1 Tax=Winogradskyella eckloniae TaxID=1089306 RepID=UPI0015653823|nr:hypothetical protein [Winogradskyella eckloniae]NRD20853.1 hypothetical protein [Winogradskyella eckloniae]